MAHVFIQLGSNLDDRAAQLATARALIHERIGPILLASGIYETPAWGLSAQPDFLNQVLELESSLSPANILSLVLDIENGMGRVRHQKWGPRLIDIDILGIDDLIIDTPELQVPHPWLHARSFVLEPFAEIAPHWIHPLRQQSVADMLALL